ncbi:hypothetical protein [Burkholderia ubonensis]|uniref:hypothetical protein n=1 Tax=Burkholderia ubonensis TaxID=101571 RepID=UPI000AA5D2BE|nr:hypothetical protein [Burkholderia ubonensis]
MSNPPGVIDSGDSKSLEIALAELQATAAQFSATCISDARARTRYAKDIAAAANEFRLAAYSGRLSMRDAAEQARAMRNQIMELSRLRSSPVIRAYATRIKGKGRSLSFLAEKYAQVRYSIPFGALSEQQQASVYADIIRASGRPDQNIMKLAEKMGRAGRRALLVSLAIAAYEVAESDNKPREVARQGTLAGAGMVGGWATGAAAVAGGLCAATAPVCVAVVGFVGGMLAAYGADAAFGTLYPRTRPITP